RLKRVRAEEEGVPGYRIRVWLPERVLIFTNDLDVGAQEHLIARTEAVPRVVLRCRCPVNKIRMGIHRVVVEGSDQPGIEPIIGSREPTGEFNGGSRGDGWGRPGSDNMIVVVAKHAKPE